MTQAGGKERSMNEADLAREAVINAAMEWWAAKRPTGWTVEQHLENPRIGHDKTWTGKELALRVAELVAVLRGIEFRTGR